MPRKKFKCKQCSRTFSMPAHLARHMTAHASRKTATKKAAGEGSSFADAAGILNSIQAYHGDLLVRRDQVDREISALDDALVALGSKQNGVARRVVQTRRPKGMREGSLKDFIIKVLGRQSTPATPKEIAIKVIRAGYKSNAKNLNTVVSVALPKIKKVKRVGFGNYILR